MRRFQVEQGVTQEVALLPTQKRSKEKRRLLVERGMVQEAVQVRTQKRRLRAWHVLVPVFTVFWIAFAIVLIASNFFFFSR